MENKIFCSEITDNTRCLTQFVNSNKILKEDIVQIIRREDNKYIIFYYKQK